MRHHNARGICLQRTDDVAVAALGNARQHVHVGNFCGTDGILNGCHRIRYVLQIDPEAVKAAHRGDLGCTRIGKIQFCTGGNFAGSHLPQNAALSHQHRIILFFGNVLTIPS